MNKTELNKQAKQVFDKYVEGLAVGETIGRCHDGCPAGTDTRNRLYFTRKAHPKDLIVWFCHNCGNGGAFSRSKRHTMLSKMGEPEKDGTAHIREIAYRSKPVAEAYPHLSMEQYMWLQAGREGHVKDLYAVRDAVRWDYVDNSIVFLIYTPNNEDPDDMPDAIQKRYHSDYGPKCLTFKKSDDVKVRQYLAGGDELTFIVEDYLSGTFLHKLGRSSYILFGNNMDIAELAEHKELLGNEIVVWLDNDNAQVIENSYKIAKRAKMLGYKVHRVPEPYVDAKKYNKADLLYTINRIKRGDFIYE